MKILARSSIWWLNIDKCIENFVSKCFACQSTQKIPKEKVISKSKPSTKPLERVHIDFFYFDSETFFIYIDSFSKYIIVKYLAKTDAINLGNI